MKPSMMCVGTPLRKNGQLSRCLPTLSRRERGGYAASRLRRPGSGIHGISHIFDSQYRSTTNVKLTVTDARHFVKAFEPKEIALGAGESGVLTVTLSIPGDTAPGVSDDIVTVATSTAGPATSNSSVVNLSVISSDRAKPR